MIQIAIAVAASVLLVASFITFEPTAPHGSVTLKTGERASTVDIDSAGAGLPVLPPPRALDAPGGGTRLQGSGLPAPPAARYTSMLFEAGP